MSYAYSGSQLRPSVTGTRGMVSSTHPLATLAGLRTLMEGGNAIDAAVAVASCVGATEIGLSGIGGVGWMQIYHAKTDTHTCLDYQGWSPYAAERDRFDSLCGSTALLRAYDVTTVVWSNWLTPSANLLDLRGP